MPSDLRPFIDEIEANARTATDAARQREGCADMGYADHVLRLVASGRPFLPRENPLWLTSRTRHIRRIGKLAFCAFMEPRVIDISLSRRRPRWVQPVTATAHSKVTPLQHRMQVDRGVTWLTGVVFLPEPPRQRRQANAKILRDLLPRPSSGWCKPPASRRNSGGVLFPFPTNIFWSLGWGHPLFPGKSKLKHPLGPVDPFALRQTGRNNGVPRPSLQTEDTTGCRNGSLWSVRGCLMRGAQNVQVIAACRP